MLGLLTLFLLSVSLSGVYSSTVVDLTGNWTIKNAQEDYKMEGRVPGSMYTALYENKLIPDPLYRDNDVKQRWVGREDWTFSRSFMLNSSDLASNSLLLVCDGLDTFSTVFINDKQVGVSDNMFVQYVYDIKSAAKDGNNTIRIDFKSAVTVAAEKSNASAYDIPKDCPIVFQHGECHVNMIRKEQCSFSWNWGPSFPTQGIWKNIYIEAFNTATIRELSVAPYLSSSGDWWLDIRVFFDVSGQLTGILTTSLIGTEIIRTRSVKLTSDKRSTSYTVIIPSSVDIERWWPNGYGSPTLYSLNVSFACGQETSYMQRRVGFRTAQLVQDGIRNGTTFYFKINDEAIFFKGTNWIPADSFQETITRERLRRLLVSAADVHINSMRVWGGGIYESDDLYELADELGIMIWQDLMFSVALYPATQEFLNSVSQEITHQIRRLRHHPSIVLWSGNNENEMGLRSGWYGVRPNEANYTRYYDDYVTLYVKTIMPIVQNEDPTRKYLTSSPSNGPETEKEGWVAEDANSEFFGDVHFYNSYANMWNASIFPVPRFASEYGVQAWCNSETLETVFADGDWDYWGNMSAHRDHLNGVGNSEMMTRIVQHFKKPVNPDIRHRFLDIIYLTQINQAVSVKAQSEHYRRWSSHVTSDGRGRTMGALYWQLNDIWQAPTWSSIDYDGKWKMLHYYTKRFFAPILLSSYVNGSEVHVYLVIDGVPLLKARDTESSSISENTLYVQMYRWDNFRPLKTWNVSCKLSRSSEQVFQQDISSLVSESGCPDRSSCFLYMYVDNPDSGIDSNLPLTYYKDVKGLDKAHIKLTRISALMDTVYLVYLETDRIAPFVWLDAYGIPGRFSENGFLMLTKTRLVTFQSWDPVDLQTFKSSLTVKSLMDVQT